MEGPNERKPSNPLREGGILGECWFRMGSFLHRVLCAHLCRTKQYSAFLDGIV